MAKGLVSGLIVGAVSGAAAALLWAPKAGQETRKLAKERGAKYVESVRVKVERGALRDTSSHPVMVEYLKAPAFRWGFFFPTPVSATLPYSI